MSDYASQVGGKFVVVLGDAGFYLVFKLGLLRVALDLKDSVAAKSSFLLWWCFESWQIYFLVGVDLLNQNASRLKLNQVEHGLHQVVLGLRKVYVQQVNQTGDRG